MKDKYLSVRKAQDTRIEMLEKIVAVLLEQCAYETEESLGWELGKILYRSRHYKIDEQVLKAVKEIK